MTAAVRAEAIRSTAATATATTASGLPEVVNQRNRVEETVFNYGDWQTVNGTKDKFFVYSAYLDRRYKNNPYIRIIATTKTKNYDRVVCLLYFENVWEFVPAKMRLISEHFNLPFSAAFVICPLKNATHVPANISVVVFDPHKRIYFPAANRLPVLKLEETPNIDETVEEKIAICIKPIHYEYNKIFQLVEFLELNRLLGVDHFVSYNKSISAEATCILNEYIGEGIVSIHPWNFPLKSQLEIRTENIFAALNDCLYRYMHSYSYILFADLDEFVIPQMNSTIPEMLRLLNKRFDTSRISAYLFQNAFFYLQWEDDPDMAFANDIEKHLFTLRKTRRRVKLNPHKQRSKFIVKPKNVMEVGNHFVWQFLHRQQTMNVLPDVAILHHYRICEFGGDDCIKLPSIVDRTVYHYRRSLNCKFARRWRSLSTKCSLPYVDLSCMDNNC
ncbi:hypothetical protein V9T40_010595 [Parthenolecanium corni]|uniref:Glycosyltransferase family 92 protein n=1 Tax=Parthenolecanium corni TaxID=536013 RepID=A0AAN9XXT2_9HEMI